MGRADVGPASRPHETAPLLRAAPVAAHGACCFPGCPAQVASGTADVALSLKWLQASAGLYIMVTLRFLSGPGKTNSTIRGTHLEDVI